MKTTMMAVLAATTLLSSPVVAEIGPLELQEVTLGFLRVTDMAPLAVALEKGYFTEEGLIVSLEAQDNWSSLSEGVASGQLAGGQMLSGQPLGAAIGYGAAAEIVVPFVMDQNGNAITVSNEVWETARSAVPKMEDGRVQQPVGADNLYNVIQAFSAAGRPLNLGMVSPVSPQNYELRYWLAAGGVHPGFYAPGDADGQLQAQAVLSVVPPPQMAAAMGEGQLDGFSVGQPWNSVALSDGVGVPVITDAQIFQNNPEKVLGFTADFVEQNPNTTKAIVRALIRASMWLDANGNEHRAEAVEILARPEYVGVDAGIIGPAMLGTFEFEVDDVREMPDFNIFFRGHASYPFYSDAIWTLTQMRRWGQIAEGKPDAWYHDIAAGVYRPDIYMEAANSLVEGGTAVGSDFPYTDGYRPPTPAEHFIDAVPFNAREPNAYLDQFAIGLKGEQTIVGGEVQG